MIEIWRSSCPTYLLPNTRLSPTNYPGCVTRTTDPKKFRELVREMAALLAYEATADLVTVPRSVGDSPHFDDRC